MSQVAQCQGKGGSEPHGLAISLESLIVLFEIPENAAEVILSQGKIGIEFNRFAEGSSGFLESALHLERKSQVVVAVRVVWKQGGCLLRGGDSAGHIARHSERFGEIAVVSSRIGRERNRSLHQLSSPFELTALVCYHAEQMK